jgi:hypothetical protein
METYDRDKFISRLLELGFIFSSEFDKTTCLVKDCIRVYIAELSGMVNIYDGRFSKAVYLRWRPDYELKSCEELLFERLERRLSYTPVKFKDIVKFVEGLE